MEVARRVAEVGGPVGALDPRVEARVHERDGFVISFWTYYPPTGTGIAPDRYADALVRHHAALRRIELDAPHVTDRVAGALREVADREQTPDLPESDRELLHSTLSEMIPLLGGGPRDLLHGEPHPGNLIDTTHGPLFIDLATCCRGPVEFDLAHAPEEVGAHYPGVDPDLLAQCRTLGWALFATWRWRRDDQLPDRDRWRAEGLNRVRAAHP
ncbi:phosphotransferase [Pseudonocardia sp. CA-107938]|uniref:phosphotransferase n=1 Tax=Pseudonocardia sp. CA-107938 TaxID=3240021 RepID=UPI003D92CE1E